MAIGAITLVGAVAVPSTALAAKKAAKDTTVAHDDEAGGDHWRLQTGHGVVHVWRPRGYDAATAGTVIYVHGYHVTVDEAWKDYRLAKQFRLSHQNALFIVPDAPGSNDDGVKWPALGELLKVVRGKTHVALPDGEVVVFGHSGAFRTITNWLDYTRMDYIILLDALYADQEKFKAWLETSKGHEANRLVVVASETLDNAIDFIRGFKSVVKRDDIPEKYEEFTKNQKRARLLFMKSQYGHMELVTNEKVIPLLLRLTPLKFLSGDGS